MPVVLCGPSGDHPLRFHPIVPLGSDVGASDDPFSSTPRSSRLLEMADILVDDPNDSELIGFGHAKGTKAGTSSQARASPTLDYT